jgi:hypothetical protein
LRKNVTISEAEPENHLNNWMITNMNIKISMSPKKETTHPEVLELEMKCI